MSKDGRIEEHQIEEHQDVLRCPECRGSFVSLNGSWKCESCGSVFDRNDDGYIEFMVEEAARETQSTTPETAACQSSTGAIRVDEEYIKPFVRREDCLRVLDVGCGVGRTVSGLLEEGYDAYGADLPCLSSYWADKDNSPDRFVCCDALRLPFADDAFDVVISLGVIEHIGTVKGHTTLGPGYAGLRRRFAGELLRVTRPGGRILIACPNKRFPIDPQHQVADEGSRHTLALRIRDAIFRRTGLNIHPVWGDYHLLSYADVRQLFYGGGASGFEALPIRNYFGFTRFKTGYLRIFDSMAQLWLNNMPAALRTTFINPYVIVQIRK